MTPQQVMADDLNDDDRALIAERVRTQGTDVGQTFAGHPMGCAAALAAIDEYENGPEGVYEAWRRADAVVRVNRRDLPRLREYTDSAYCIPNGYSRDRFPLLDRDAAREALDVAPDTDLVFSLGVLKERKGYHYLVEAVADLVERRAETLRATLDADAAALAEHLPEWHLAAYVDPGHENVPALSHLLEDLAVVYLARAEPLDERGLLKRALDDFYRAPEGPIANVDMVAPTLEDADLHAWLADGVPVEAFTPTAAAYEHRLERSTATEPLDVAVVLNDAAMVAEHDEVGRIYRDADRAADVVVYEDIPTASLARVFEDDHDFVHFIGHCEEGGLRCPDGLLDIASLCSVGARTFFLNACGSFYQGHALVERGSVAGAVTLRGVLNEPAARVGTTFARLLIEGFCIGRALSLARRRITMSTDYVAVGDGTYALASDESPLASLDRVADGYHVEYTVPATRHVGSYFEDPFDGCERLRGTAATATVSPGDLPGVLDMLDCPVVYDGELRWSRDLAAILRGR